MLIGCYALAADADRRGKREGFENGIVDVATHVAKRARAEIESLAPVARMVPAFDGGAIRADTEPELPVEIFGNGFGAVVLHAFVAPCLVRPRVNLANLPDGAALHELNRSAVLGARMDLDSHLRHRLFPTGKLREAPAFEEI